MEGHGIECILIISIQKLQSFLVGDVYRPPETPDYVQEDLNEKFETKFEKVFCEVEEAILMVVFYCDYEKERSNGP